MKNASNFLVYLCLMAVCSCTDHRLPPGVSCDEFSSRIKSCPNWQMTSRTVNAVEAIQACSLPFTLVFIGNAGAGGIGPANRFRFSAERDPEFCATGGTSGGTFSCNNGEIILLKTVGSIGGYLAGPLSQTLYFLSPTSFLLTYTDSKGNAITETYVAAC